MIRHVLVPTLLVLCASPAAAAPQPPVPAEAAESREETFFESIDVQVVNVEVYVTGRDGKRVTGLTRDDFELLEDGRPVELTNFFAVGGGTQDVPGAEPAAAVAGADQRLHLALVLDDLTLTPQSRNRLIQAVEADVLPHLRADDRALVAVVEGGTLRVTQGLTSDPEALRAALQTAALGAPQGLLRVAAKRELLSRIESIGLPMPGDPGAAMQVAIVQQVYEDLKSYAAERAIESRAGLGAVADFVASLSGLPGRKAVLYLGGGLSVRPGEALFQAWESKFGAAARTRGFEIHSSIFDGRRDDLTREVQDLADTANANRVTFYTAGTTEELAGVSAAASFSASWGSTLEALEKANLRASLDTLAGGTGGLSAVDLPNPGALFGRMREDFDVYYSLGYVPERRRDGKNRKLEVRVRGRQDLQVRSRAGRRDTTNQERMSGRTLAALVLDPGANPLELAVECTGETRDKDQFLVDVLVKFPLAKLVLLPKESFHEGRVTLYVGARDSRGRTSPIQAIVVPVRVPNDQLLTVLGQTAAYKTTLRLRDDAHTIAVAMRDELGNADAAVAVKHRPGQ